MQYKTFSVQLYNKVTWQKITANLPQCDIYTGLLANNDRYMTK